MKAKLLLALFASALLFTTCSIDFNEAVPCETDEHCPEGMGCDSEVNRCVLGSGSSNGSGQDAGTDPISDTATDTIVNDPVVTPDLAQDTASEPTVDIVVETTPEVQEDTGSDVCVPSMEVCNGEDDDCNGEADDGLECGTCPDEEMVLIVRPGITVFCIDRYEASRPDATLTDPGDEDNCSDPGDVVSCVAYSLSNRAPWSLVDLSSATAACENAGKRLCTPNEWSEGCGGPTGNLYPYNASEYDAFTCNGTDSGAGYAAAAEVFPFCVSPEGVSNMSGNLEEWVADETTRGGSYQDSNLLLRCSGEGETPTTTTTHDTVGFRCCADATEPD